jgi:hypothetical protein
VVGFSNLFSFSCGGSFILRSKACLFSFVMSIFLRLSMNRFGSDEHTKHIVSRSNTVSQRWQLQLTMQGDRYWRNSKWKILPQESSRTSTTSRKSQLRSSRKVISFAYHLRHAHNNRRDSFYIFGAKILKGLSDKLMYILRYYPGASTSGEKLLFLPSDI